jgi:presenilin-like A22 family membrane protease
MKHTLKVTLIILLLFFVAQVIGLYVTDHFALTESLPLNIERPQVQENTSFIMIFVFIIIATALALLLMRLELFKVWKFWFLLSVFFTLTISWSAFMWEWLAIGLAIIFAYIKVFKPHPLVHNFTELFIYGALAAIFVPIMNLWTIIILLVLISVYDYIAVRKTKHMIKLAKSQSKAKVFAGLLIPYKKNVAMLGGGDIGFPLLFAGVVMKVFGLGLLDPRTYIVPLFAALGLLYLFIKGEKKKFYPAMPYVTAGCLIGLGIVYLLMLI